LRVCCSANPGTYHFDQFDVRIDLPTYSDQEYEQFLQDEDWTKDETDYLWSLCGDFDLRWIIIADRYDYQDKQRTMEDLKDRYYSAVRKLLLGQTPESLMTTTQLETYNSYKWDKSKEIERKEYVENLYKRTPEQIAEENALMAELKRIEAYEKKSRAEREELMNLLESPRAMGDTRGYEGSQGMNILYQTLVAADKSRVKQQQRKQSVSQVGSSQLGGQDSAMNARDEVSRRFRPFSPKEGTLYFLHLTLEYYYGIAYPEKTTQGAILRSLKITIQKPTIAQKVSNVFKEMEISEKMAMPTALVCEKMEKLQGAVQLMLEAKKNVDRTDQELRIAAARKEGSGHGTRAVSVGDQREKRSASVATDGDGGDTKRHRRE
jgi:DNA methyltransferase 1-associated protein 1